MSNACVCVIGMYACLAVNAIQIDNRDPAAVHDFAWLIRLYAVQAAIQLVEFALLRSLANGPGWLSYVGLAVLGLFAFVVSSGCFVMALRVLEENWQCVGALFGFMPLCDWFVLHGWVSKDGYGK